MQTGGRQDGRRAMQVPKWPLDAQANDVGERAGMEAPRGRTARADYGAGSYEAQADEQGYARQGDGFSRRQNDRYDADGRSYERQSDGYSKRQNDRYDADRRSYAGQGDGYSKLQNDRYAADERSYAGQGYGYARRQDDRYAADGRSYTGQSDGYARRHNDRYAADGRSYTGQSDSYARRQNDRYADDRRSYAGQGDSYAKRQDDRYAADERSYAGQGSGYGDDARRRLRADSAARRASDDDYGRDFADDEDQGYERDYGRRNAGPNAFERMTEAARRAGERLRDGAQARRASRRTRIEPDDSDQRDSAVFGGREHDNIHAADARPGVGRAPIVAMILVVVLLVVFVPMMVQAWNRRAALGGNAIAVQGAVAPGVSITAQPGSVIPTPTPEPTATPQPDAAVQAAPEATSSGLIVSQYTERTLDRNRPAVALTFDDGPSEQTARILDALEANGGLGTFFLIGERVATGEYADALRRQREMGCLVGTHMYSHTKLTELTADELTQELSQCVAAHEAAGSSVPEIARAPYGQVSDEVLSALGLPMVNWSLNSNDWQTQDADRIYNDVMNSVQDGDIVLFHDLKDFTAAALERIAPALTAQGYQLVTVQELFELKGQTLEPGKLYAERVVAAGV